jgi:hypothetical protein
MSYPSVDQLQTPDEEYATRVREIIRAGKRHLRNTSPLNYDLKDIALLAQLATNIKILEAGG